MLSELEKKIIASIQGQIPICERPYLEIANRLNISEAQLLEVLQSLVDRGVIRRFGATLKHQKTGFRANAMGAWQVDEARIDAVGTRMAASKHISHCYRRNPTEGWPYNLYTMIHAADEVTCREVARKLAEETGVDRYQLLFSRRELKKTSMKYFTSVPPESM